MAHGMPDAPRAGRWSCDVRSARRGGESEVYSAPKARQRPQTKWTRPPSPRPPVGPTGCINHALMAPSGARLRQWSQRSWPRQGAARVHISSRVFSSGPRVRDPEHERGARGEDSAVPLIRDPTVEQQNNSPVLLRPNQPTKALAEAKHRLGERIRTKGVEALSLEALVARLLNGLGRYAKGEARDDDQSQLVALDIDAFPERVGRGGRSVGPLGSARACLGSSGLSKGRSCPKAASACAWSMLTSA